ncbi:winged helix-turn-helix transcriptional regulator [Candidatus Bathyarchaeota archaeon]|nr:winged helix-turn-helix transcriptional regulator [Candidatus Bathyarchaeota archaeon]
MIKRKALEILCLLEKKPLHIRGLHRQVGGSLTTVVQRVDELVKAGLIAQMEVENRKVLRLTSRGKMILAMLRSIGMIPGGKRTEKVDVAGRSKWILFLLYALGGRIKGSTRLEKLLFLLSKKFKIIEEGVYEFRPYLFGPFSAQVLNDAQGLQSMGLIEIEDEIFGAHDMSDFIYIRKNYQLTQEGMKIARKIYEQLIAKSDVRKVLPELRKLNFMPLHELLDYIYREFPEYAGDEYV